MKRLFVAVSLLGFLIGCGDRPPSTAVLTLPPDVSVKTTSSFYMLVNAKVTDPARDDIPVNGVEILFLCMGCQFAQLGDGITEGHLVNWVNDTYIIKETDRQGVARVWVYFPAGTTSATVSGSLENGSGDTMKVDISAP